VTLTRIVNNSSGHVGWLNQGSLLRLLDHPDLGYTSRADALATDAF